MRYAEEFNDPSKAPDATVLLCYRRVPEARLTHAALLTESKLRDALGMDEEVADLVLRLHARRKYSLNAQASLTWKAITDAATTVISP